MPKVYRIERGDGLGPYRFISWQIIGRHTVEAGKPGPDGHPQDSEMYRTLVVQKQIDRFFFGFRSLEELLDWFDEPDENYELMKIGCKVAVYEADYIIDGINQCAFYKDYSAQIESWEMPECMFQNSKKMSW